MKKKLAVGGWTAAEERPNEWWSFDGLMDKWIIGLMDSLNRQ